MASSVLGMWVGIAESMAGHRVWVLLGGMAILLVGIRWITAEWICRPLTMLIKRLRVENRGENPTDLNALPAERRDEVGQLARELQKLGSRCRHEHEDAAHLRRVMDHRIQQSVSKATLQLHRLAYRDGLTGVGNRLLLTENLEDVVQSVRDAGEDLVCMLLDMDNFKQVNDRLGHAAGDDLLKTMGELLRTTVREGDLAIRLGGDEFVLLLPGCTIERADQVSHQLITLFNQHCTATLPSESRASLSIGVASLSMDKVTTGEDLLEAADQKLYKAKGSGKGRAVSR